MNCDILKSSFTIKASKIDLMRNKKPFKDSMEIYPQVGKQSQSE